MRFYEDLDILIGEANFADEGLLRIRQQKLSNQSATVSLTISISMVLVNMIKYVNLGFRLDIYLVHEMLSVMSYLRYLYTLIHNNRKIMITSFCSDMYKKNLISFDDKDPNPQFKKKRKRMTPAQKQVCDEY
jgi:hypothetical protein